MTGPVASNGDIIRQASKATIFLQVVAAVLMLGLIYLLSGIYERYQAIHDGVRENALWSVYQLDRETRRFHEEAEEATEPGGLTAQTWRSLNTRYDILYSRVGILQKAKLDLDLSQNGDLIDTAQKIEAEVLAMTPFFDAVAAGGLPDPNALRTFVDRMDPLLGMTEKMLVGTNSMVNVERAESRDRLSALQIKSGVVIALLIACMAVLVVSLQRQLRTVRAAGLSFETIAAKLQDAYAKAQAGNRAKSQFMATMGHEVRTPLNAVLGTAELLELDDLPERVRAGVHTIRRSGQLLLEILNEILDFAKMETGRIDIRASDVDILALVKGTVDMLKDRASEAGNTLVLDIAPGFSLEGIHTDPTRLRQVLLNLLSNAIKFTTRGTVTLQLSCKETADGEKLRIAVVDTGIGIDAEGQTRLFEPFSQVDATIGRKYGGTGLGLTICKEIVTALGGVIGVDSEKGKGSTFWLEVPALRTQRPPAPAEQSATTLDAASLPRLRILLAEDNKVNQQVATGFLRHLGQEVVTVDDGEDAVSAMARETFDLVLMDMQMPRLDGIAATRRIMAMGGRAARTPVYAMTANASEDDRRLCLEAGMRGFRCKPVTLHQLATVIREAAPLQPRAGDDRSAEPMPAPATRPPNERQREIIETLGEDIFDELLRSFFADAAAILKQLGTALGGADPLPEIDSLLHAFKGAAASVGFQELADEAQRLRHAALDGASLDALQTKVNESRERRAA